MLSRVHPLSGFSVLHYTAQVTVRTLWLGQLKQHVWTPPLDPQLGPKRNSGPQGQRHVQLQLEWGPQRQGLELSPCSTTCPSVALGK